MQALALLTAVVALGSTVAIGIVIHELSHAAVLHSLGVPYDIEWFPDHRTTSYFATGVFGSWASVTPGQLPASVPAWGLRLSAMAPLALLLPFVLVIVGTVPDPLESQSLWMTAVTIGWLACALPSPQDFSVLFYADRFTNSR